MNSKLNQEVQDKKRELQGVDTRHRFSPEKMLQLSLNKLFVSDKKRGALNMLREELSYEQRNEIEKKIAEKDAIVEVENMAWMCICLEGKI